MYCIRTGSSSHVSLSTLLGSQAITIHCRSMAWVRLFSASYRSNTHPTTPTSPYIEEESDRREGKGRRCHGWGTELIQFYAALEILHPDDLKKPRIFAFCHNILNFKLGLVVRKELNPPPHPTPKSSKSRMKRITATWRNGCFQNMVHTTPNCTTLPKWMFFQEAFLQIILTVKWIVRHSSMSPKQQRRPLPSLLSDSSSMSPS